MRVEVVENMPEPRGAMGKAAEDPAVKLALLNFRSAIQSEDSLFAGHPAEAGPISGGDTGGGSCFGDFVVSFREEKLSRDRGMHFQLIQKLVELLKHTGSQEVLNAKLCLISGGQKGIATGQFALRIQLEAGGESREQAALRWGLGLAQLQQALLFTSRYLRQAISQKSG
jgi:hypothetical protein